MNPDRAGHCRDEPGQVTVTIIGFAVVIGLLVAVVVNASAAYLAQRRLADLSDGAALAAAEGVRRDRLYTDLGSNAPLDADAARSEVAAYLAEAGVAADGVRWTIVQAGDGVHVRLEATVELPLVPPGWSDGVVVRGEAGVLLRAE